MFDFLFARSRARTLARPSKPALEQLEERCLMAANVLEYAIPTAPSGPLGIAAGRDGNLWFTESVANKVGYINPITHAIVDYALPTANASPGQIVADRNGNLWFTESGANQIGVVNASTHAINEFAIPTAGAQPYGLTLGGDGNVWFTEITGNKIGRVDTLTGAIAEYAIPTTGAMPASITLGSDGNLWFTEYHSGKIGVLYSFNNAIGEYAIPTANSAPFGIAAGWDGNLWFTEFNGNKIANINPSTHAILEISMLQAGDGPFGVTAGPNGKMWFTEIMNNAIGQIDVNTDAIMEMAVPRPQITAYAITTGPDGNIWFAEAGTGYIGEIMVPPSVLLQPQSQVVAPGQTTYLTTLASGSPMPGTITTVIPGQVSIMWQTVTSPLVTVQWVVSIDGGKNFFPLSDDGINYLGAHTGMLTILNPTLATNGFQYEAIFSNGLVSSPAQLTVVQPLSITPALPSGWVGVNYNQSINVTNSATPFTTFTVSNFSSGGTGMTASNFTINAAAGVITLSGTPAAPGAISFTVTAVNSGGASVVKKYTIAINTALGITTSLPGGVVGKTYSQTIQVTGGALPLTSLSVDSFSGGTTGLTMAILQTNGTAGTVTINGTPKAAGTITFTVNVIDSSGSTLTKTYTISVVTPLAITPSVPSDTVGIAYNQTITVTGGAAPYTTFTVTNFSAGTTDWSLADITANANAGTVFLSKTPTAAGTATFTVSVIDSNGNTLTRNFSLIVNAAPTLGSLTTSQWTVGKSGFTGTLAITGGTGPYTIVSAAGLPTGMAASLTGSTVKFNGTPSATGTYNGTVTIQDFVGASTSANFTITINAAPTVSALTASQWSIGRPGFPGTMTISNGTGPFTIVASSVLPSGLTAFVSGQTIAFTGTPTFARTFTGSVTIQDAAGAQVIAPTTITINPSLAATPSSLPQGTAGANYVQTISVTGGTGPFVNFLVTGFNGGTTGLTAGAITTNAGAGTVAVNGTPSAAGTASFTVNVLDAAGAVFTRTYTITINPAISVGALTRTQWDANAPGFNGTMTIAGGTGPFALTSAVGLPPGLVAHLTNRLIFFTGIPSTAGSFTPAITVQDAAGATITQSFSITINGMISFPQPSLPQGTATQVYNQTLTVSGGTMPFQNLGLAALDTGTTGLPQTAISRNWGAGTVTINGTSQAAGTITLTAAAQDAIGAWVFKVYTITINALPSMSNLTQTQWTQNTFGFTGTLGIVGGTGPFTLINSSGLPTGLTANVSGRTVSFTGTPTAAGTYGAGSVTLQDAYGVTFSKAFTITINQPLVITTASLPAWTSNVSYSATITTTGGTGTIKFTRTAGTLPTGLALSTSGVISGLSHAAGSFTFDVTATDAIGATFVMTYTL